MYVIVRQGEGRKIGGFVYFDMESATLRLKEQGAKFEKGLAYYKGSYFKIIKLEDIIRGIE